MMNAVLTRVSFGSVALGLAGRQGPRRRMQLGPAGNVLPCSWEHRDQTIYRKIRCSSQSQTRQGDDEFLLQDSVQAQRRVQVSTTQLLSKLLSAVQEEGGAEKVAEEHVEDFDEAFFHVASAYLEMAKKEDEDSFVVQQLEAVLRIAMRAKQATLRPEIQLLNGLLAAENWHEMESVLQSAEAEQILMMNDRYFFGLVDRMMNDVSRHQPELARKLETIKKSAVQRVLRT
jgi:hypothetical protein